MVLFDEHFVFSSFPKLDGDEFGVVIFDVDTFDECIDLRLWGGKAWMKRHEWDGAELPPKRSSRLLQRLHR